MVILSCRRNLYVVAYFIQSITDPSELKGKNFASNQEGIRKCVERVFVVLFKRFKLLFIACEFWSIDKMKQIVTAVVIIHNMIVEVRRENYESDGTADQSRFFNAQDVSHQFSFVRSSPGNVVLERTTTTVSDDIKVKGMHQDLKEALIEHNWNKFGGSGI